VSSLTVMGSDSFRRFRWSRTAMREDANTPLQYRVNLIAACVRKAPAAMSLVVSRLEQAFAGFAKVPYHDASTRRELEQLLDDLED
jgi:hypothetical protein